MTEPQPAGRSRADPEPVSPYGWLSSAQVHEAPHPSGPPDLVLRPRLWIRAITVVLGVGGPVGFVAISYQASYLDPRVILMALYSVVIVAGVTRTRMFVVDGVIHKRLLVGQGVVALNNLADVRVNRSRYLKRQGILPANLANVVDRTGRAITFKPVLWQKGAGPVLATLAVCSRSQGLVTDERTAKVLGRANETWAYVVPGWAYGTRTDSYYLSASPSPRRIPFLISRLLISRDAEGNPKKLQWRLLVVTFAMIGLALPPMWLISRVGTAAIRSARCGSVSALWTHAPDFPTDPSDVVPIGAVTGGANVFITWMGRPTLYTLTSAGIANQYNTPAVQRDAKTLVAGQDLRWQQGNSVLADVQVEQFPSHHAALTYQSDYGQDHCQEGDHLFATPGIPGGIGVRCQCTGSTVDDRISFVRGPWRVQVIDWVVLARQAHEAVTRLALEALRATAPLEPNS